MYDTFKAFSTLELSLEVTNLLNESIKAKKDNGEDAVTLSQAAKPISTGEVSLFLYRLIDIHLPK